LEFEGHCDSTHIAGLAPANIEVLSADCNLKHVQVAEERKKRGEKGTYQVKGAKVELLLYQGSGEYGGQMTSLTAPDDNETNANNTTT